jgi:hypothetical protein
MCPRSHGTAIDVKFAAPGPLQAPIERRRQHVRTDLLGWLRLQWDRATAWTCLLAGVITLFVGWVGVSRTAYTAKQLPYIASNGIGGLFLLGTGAMLWLSADLRDEWRKLDRIEAAIRESGTVVLPRAPAAPQAAHAAGRTSDGTNGSRPDTALASMVAGRAS